MPTALWRKPRGHGAKPPQLVASWRQTRPRSYPRTRKRPVSPYSSHRADDRQPSPKVHYKITLTVPP